MKAGTERVEVSVSANAQFAWHSDCPVVLHFRTRTEDGFFSVDDSIGAQELGALLEALTRVLDRMRDAKCEAE